MSHEPLPELHPPKGYRPNVGIAIFNPAGLIWVGKRRGFNDYYSWQLPQGGVDEGESLEEAAFRETEEETGIAASHLTLLGSTEGWLTYEFPAEMRARPGVRGNRGQAQRWFAFRFSGSNSDINLDRHHPEFDAWRWEPLHTIPALVIPFKRPVYEAVVKAFASFALPTA
jgi:putative (di)nucleoside polyphosphate hydrolase